MTTTTTTIMLNPKGVDLETSHKQGVKVLEDWKGT